MASGWNLWVWLVSVVVRRYIIEILIIIITFPHSTCISSFFGRIIPISLFIFKNVFSFLYNSGRSTVRCARALNAQRANVGPAGRLRFNGQYNRLENS